MSTTNPNPVEDHNLIEKFAQQHELTITRWDTDGIDERPDAYIEGDWIYVGTDGEDLGLSDEEQGELVLSAVGAAEYHNVHVQVSFRATGMEEGVQVSLADLERI